MTEPLCLSITLPNKAFQALPTLSPARSDLSPLPNTVDADIVTAGRARLVEAGLLDPGGRVAANWRPAIDALTRPLRRVTFSVGGPNGVSTLRAFQGELSGTDFAVVAARGSVATTLAYPVDAADLALPLFEALGLEGETPDLGIGVDLTAAGFVALMGMVDALREAEAEAMLARDEAPVAGVSPAAIALALKTGWESADFRWLVPMARRLLPMPVEIDKGDIEAGLAELACVGLVRQYDRDGLFYFSADFEVPRRTLSVPFAFGQLALTEANGAGLSQSFVSGLRTLGSLWAFEFVAGTPPLMRVRTLTEEDFLGAIGDLLARPPKVATLPASVTPAEPAALAGAAMQVHRFCTACGASLPAGAKFCTACGKQV